MALKKRPTKSQGEQLYMLEVFVDQLSLNPELTNTNIENLIFYVRFADLPLYEIHVPKNDEAIATSSHETDDDFKEYKFGKSCLFTKTPVCLIKALRWSSLSLELYDRDATCSRKSRVPLGSAKLTLPACMCKQVIAAQKKVDGIATPCTVSETFNLTDSQERVTGNVTMVLRLSCFGSPIVDHFALNGKSFMLDNSPIQKLLCPNAGKEKSPIVDSAKPSLKRPASPPRVAMNDPAFKTLTMAEKLNDPKYRALIYSAYPDEPTCPCGSKDPSSHPMKCASGCTRSCCMKLRNPDILSTQKDTNGEKAGPKVDDTYCVNNYASAFRTLQEYSGNSDVKRLRGGGDIEQLYLDPTGYKWMDYDPDYGWYDDRHNFEPRLEGGGGAEKGMSSCSCSGGPVLVPARKATSKDRDVVSVFDACTPRITSTGPKPGCACPGKDASKMPTGAATCMKSPCQGIDCLIKAFKDAQDFVDSIGKVPGLPGLGLMDPSESPFFGRDIDKDYVPSEQPPEKRKAPSGGPQSAPGQTAPVCTAPCGMHPGKAPDDARSMFGASAPPGATVPPRLGIVREAIPVLPEASSGITPAKHKKKEEKKDEKTDKKEAEGSSMQMVTEMGPCGEPKCKARRKKSADNASVTHSATSTSSKTRTGVKQAAANPKVRRKGNKTKTAPKRTPRNQQPPAEDAQDSGKKKRGVKAVTAGPGGGGDRDVAQQQEIQASKKVMRYVYFVGDYYPGINYGHRNCIDIRMRVPANMGWLWNTMSTAGNLKPRIGWRPGAIGRYLYELLQDAKDNSFPVEEPDRSPRGRTSERGKPGSDRGRSGTDRGRERVRMGSERARSAPSRQKNLNRRQRAMSYQGMQKQSKMEGEQEGPESPPTLHIHRKDGTYYVTMYPIRQETSAEPRVTEPMKPLQFKIVKNKEDASDASSSTASDMEIEFSPPAAVSRIRKKPDVIHVDTQVRQQEILDAYKAEALKKKGRRNRREKKANPSRVEIRK